MELEQHPLSWRDNTPYSATYDDIYYMPQGGLDETRHVFLHSNRLPERLSDARHFTIGETGFGTGLNFLALLQLWQSLPEPRPRLHYITTELHPLTAADLAEAQLRWPELAEYAHALQTVYPPAIAGAHRRYVAEGAITIDFLWGDAANMLAQYQPADGAVTVDAWFLDGFSPDKNPTMWNDALYQAIAKLSAEGSSFATFTAAGHVRRGLQTVGFDVQRAAGYGTKREMNIGSFALPRPAIARPSGAMVIGAGIAGISAAWRLAKQGIAVQLLEAGATICSGASGNLASAFTPYIPPVWNARGGLIASGFADMQHRLDYLRAQGHRIAGTQCGTLILQFPDSTKRNSRLCEWQSQLELPDTIRRTVDAAEASALAGIALQTGGWFYPQGGWVDMRSLCEALLADAGDAIQLSLNTSITAIRHSNRGWQAESAGGASFTAPQLILANAHAAQILLPELKLTPVHGQMLQFNAPDNFSPRCLLHTGHTLLPLADGRLNWSASFRHHEVTARIIEEESERLLDDLLATFPALSRDTITPSLTHWAGLRCTHASRLPLIGAVPNQPEGLFMHLAHGARGLFTGGWPFAVAPEIF